MLAHLALNDFRNYLSAQVDFGPGVTVLHGDNGQGKTNVIEAICVLSTGSSSRPGAPEALVRQGAEVAVVRGRAEVDGRGTDVAIEIPRRGRARAAVNGDIVRRRGDALGHVRAVLFSPDDLSLVKGGPQGRRDLLDVTTALLSPSAADRQAVYERVVRQRSSLLRSLRGSGRRPPTLDVWDDKMVESGQAVLADRLALLDALAPRAQVATSDLSGGQGKLALAYRLSWGEEVDPGGRPDPEAFATALRAAVRDEIERGLCLVGPHRDDMIVVLDDRGAREAASQGEARTIALALRLAIHALATERGTAPTLLLDDVVSELDAHRAEALLALLPDCQTVITTADPPASLPLPPGARLVTVYEGTLSG